jgi:hypothetical protein
VVEEEVDIEILAAHFEVYLLADECEASPELDEELADVREQALCQLGFRGIVGQGEEVEVVGSFSTSLARSDCGAGNVRVKFVRALPWRL